jgi:hypothetical protein
MAFDPSTIPALSGSIRRGVFLSHIYRRPLAITFRGVAYTAAKTTPSAQRKATLAGYTQEVADLEIMLALPTATAVPVANSADEVVIGAQIFRITAVQEDLGPDCYQLTLSLCR